MNGDLAVTELGLLAALVEERNLAGGHQVAQEEQRVDNGRVIKVVGAALNDQDGQVRVGLAEPGSDDTSSSATCTGFEVSR